MYAFHYVFQIYGDGAICESVKVICVVVVVIKNSPFLMSRVEVLSCELMQWII